LPRAQKAAKFSVIIAMRRQRIVFSLTFRNDAKMRMRGSLSKEFVDYRIARDTRISRDNQIAYASAGAAIRSMRTIESVEPDESVFAEPLGDLLNGARSQCAFDRPVNFAKARMGSELRGSFGR
jgi:hypothetical protein